MNKIIAALALLTLLSACGQENTSTQTAEAIDANDTSETVEVVTEKHSGLLPNFMNLEVRPGDDFNAFVNGTWMDTAEIPQTAPAIALA